MYLYHTTSTIAITNYQLPSAAQGPSSKQDQGPRSKERGAPSAKSQEARSKKQEQEQNAKRETELETPDSGLRPRWKMALALGPLYLNLRAIPTPDPVELHPLTARRHSPLQLRRSALRRGAACSCFAWGRRLPSNGTDIPWQPTARRALRLLYLLPAT